MRDLIKDALNKGLTQRELANKIGFSHGTVQKILFTNTKFTYETRRAGCDGRDVQANIHRERKEIGWLGRDIHGQSDES